MQIELKEDPGRDKITDTAFMPPKWYEKFQKLEAKPVVYCSEDRMYFVDADGDVHYFRYLGKNLALGGLASG